MILRFTLHKLATFIAKFTQPSLHNVLIVSHTIVVEFLDLKRTLYKGNAILAPFHWMVYLSARRLLSID